MCVESGTHYVDITGEVPFVREIIAEHHEQAFATGTKVISCCGWDSVPAVSDLITFSLDYVLAFAQ